MPLLEKIFSAGKRLSKVTVDVIISWRCFSHYNNLMVIVKLQPSYKLSYTIISHKIFSGLLRGIHQWVVDPGMLWASSAEMTIGDLSIQLFLSVLRVFRIKRRLLFHISTWSNSAARVLGFHSNVSETVSDFL